MDDDDCGHLSSLLLAQERTLVCKRELYLNTAKHHFHLSLVTLVGGADSAHPLGTNDDGTNLFVPRWGGYGNLLYAFQSERGAGTKP